MQIVQKAIKCKDCKIKSKAVKVLGLDELQILEENCVQGTLKGGERIFHEGMPPSHIVYLRQGFCKIHMTGAGNKDQILKIAKPGAYLGLQTILGDKVSHYSATSINDCLACFMDIRIFKELIKKNGLFAYELIIYICKEELNYFHRFVDQNQKHLNGRVADAMMMFSHEIFKSPEFELPFTKSDLAALVGATRESVTRILKEFNDSNIMNMKGRNIQILDEERLKRISLTG